ncbi:acyltransferase [Globicatella sanguinis]|uniref:acyltransferase n=1 Tax=Globicatella sanguinis TaxID=13076 RepID=UPI0025431F00|nr:acyltransferase [Globicatella sanguinis]MDK7631106.1 acyltransferase [Globicatella sanguinis]WIK66114.1 acyltransferase [Globicatella sanguinis]WKT55519.1 acyltransferase [Globicatella sanguinis]
MRKVNSLNIIRTIAIYMVLIMHSTEALYDSIGYSQEINNHKIFLLFYTVGRMGVPLFLLLTGYLMLNRENNFYRVNGKNNFYQKYLFPLLIKSQLGILLLIMFDYYRGAPVDLLVNIKQLFFLHQLPGIQTWYIPVILGVYLFIPIIAIGIKNYSNKILFLLILPIFVYYCLILDVNQIMMYNGLPTFNSQANFDFIGYYGIYILLGALIKRNFVKEVPRLILNSVFLISFMILIWIQIKSYEIGNNYRIWYNDGLLLLITVPLFASLERIKTDFGRDVFEVFSKASFGVFWIHSILQVIIRNYLLDSVPFVLNVLFLSTVNLIISTMIVSVYFKFKSKISIFNLKLSIDD